MELSFKVERLYKFNGESAVKAICDISICDEFLVKGIRVINGKSGLFIGMPRGQGKDGKWYNNVFPLTVSSREALNEVVLSAYESSQN